MNVKALAAVVGTLSLGALATGCASTKSAQSQDKGADQSAVAQDEATATQEKAIEGGCKASNTSCSK